MQLSSGIRLRLPLIVAAVVAFAYLAFPAAQFNFDGVACAIAVELHDMRHLLHGNHLIYGLVGYLWCALWWALGCGWRAIYLLQILDSMLGAAAVGIFCRTLLRLGVGTVTAAAASFGLAFSALYWTWSLEAQVYPLGAFFLMLALSEATSERPNPVKTGAMHGLAVLGHVGHVMFAPAAVRLLWISNRSAVASLVRYAAAFGSVTLVAYVAAAVLWIRPASGHELRAWLLGSAALGVDKRFAWVGGYSPRGFLEWGTNSLGLFGGGDGVGLLVWSLAGLGSWLQWRRRRDLVLMCWLWLCGYALLFTCWHPGQIVYRLTDVPTAWLLGALAIEGAAGSAWWRRRLPIGFAAAVAALGVWNLTRVVIPRGAAESNEALQRALWLSTLTTNERVIVDDIDQVYVPYFALRDTLNLRYFEGKHEELKEGIRKMTGAKTRIVAVESRLPPWAREALRDLPRREIGRRGNDVLVRFVEGSD